MGKGTIVSHIADGQYNVTVNYEKTGIDARLLILADRKTLLETALAAETDAIKIRLLKLQILSVEKQIAFLNDITKVPEDETITAWCADLTTDLSGAVGTIEIGRERANGVNIQPGYDGNAVFAGARDGQLVPLMAQDSAATFYNLAMLPGFQKWKPMFRYATITEIDYDADTCTVTLDALTSSQQGLNINQEIGLSGVPIEYMECNAAAFAVDNRVIVQFNNYDFADPVVIGFESAPAPCSCFWTEEWDGPAITTKWPWSVDSGCSAFYSQPVPPYGLQQFDYSLPGGSVTAAITACTATPPVAQDCSFLTLTGSSFSLSVESGYETWAKSSSAYYNLNYVDNWINEAPKSFMANCNLNLSKLPYTFAIVFIGYLDGTWFYFDVLFKNVSSGAFLSGPAGSYSEPFRWNGTGFYETQHVYHKTGPGIGEFELIEQAGWIQPYGYTNEYMITSALENVGRILLPAGFEAIKIYGARVVVRTTSTTLTLPEWEVIINHLGVC